MVKSYNVFFLIFFVCNLKFKFTFWVIAKMGKKKLNDYYQCLSKLKMTSIKQIIKVKK